MRLFITVVIITFFSPWAKADEGMWLPYIFSDSQIETLQKKGLDIPFDSIYNNSYTSLKDAIVSLDAGACTGEFISSKGLLLTNHHCGYNEIQAHSSVDQNILKDGFWAQSHNEELPNPGKTATLLIEAHDVTKQILANVNDSLAGHSRVQLIDSLVAVAEKEAAEEYKLEAKIKPFFSGNTYILFLTQTYKDVRLVGTPPSAIGKFGGDTDNWMWPRHTGDFCFFRVYAAPDGSPAEYSKDNVPFTPKKYLQIDLSGIEENDLTITMGYPGSTNRFMTSFGVEEIQNTINPVVAEVRGIKQNIWDKAMKASPQVNIKYAAKYSKSSNYWKYSIGQNDALDKLNIIKDRNDLEARFKEWTAADSTRKKLWGKSLSVIEASYLLGSRLTHTQTVTNETMLEGSDIVMFSLDLINSFMNLQELKDDEAAYNQLLDKAVADIEKNYGDFDVDVDKNVFTAMLDYYLKNIPESLRPKTKQLLGKKYLDDHHGFIDQLYEKSAIADKDKMIHLLKKGSESALFKDPAVDFAYQVLSHLFQISNVHEKLNMQLNDHQRLLVKGYMNMQKDKDFYPDANSTMRLSYGNVGAYHPKDGVFYKHQTTLKGILEKDDKTKADFNVPEKLKDLYHQKNFSGYALENGKMPVCFITDNDITGGNSGSPVLSKDGHLIGLAFDGNWEAMTSDLAYEEQLQKCICVDIRYVLFIVDKFAGAQNLIDEMSIL